jgi:hypothetical protein
MAVPSVPDLLTVEEAARILRIGRTARTSKSGDRWRPRGGRGFPPG